MGTNDGPHSKGGGGNCLEFTVAAIVMVVALILGTSLYLGV